MSNHEFEDYYLDEMIYKRDDRDNKNELDDIYLMIYKQNENKKEEKEYIEDFTRILGEYFVKTNKNKCKIVYKNKKYELIQFLVEIDINYIHETKEIKIKLFGVNNIRNMEQMFYRCYHLSSIKESCKFKNQEKDTELINMIFENDIYSSIFEEKNYDYSNIENIYAFTFNDMLKIYSDSTLTISNIQTNNNNSNIFTKNENILNNYQKSSLNMSKICNLYCMFGECKL